MLAYINRALSPKISNHAAIVAALARPAVRTRTPLPYLGSVVHIGQTSSQSLNLCSSFFARHINTSSVLSSPRENSSSDPLSDRGGSGDGAPLKSFQEIPGPWKMPLVQLSPEVLKGDPFKSVQMVKGLQEKYGSIYKVTFSPFMSEFVAIFDPEDVSKVYRNDGKYPKRFPFDVWLEVRKKLGVPTGLFLS